MQPCKMGIICLANEAAVDDGGWQGVVQVEMNVTPKVPKSPPFTYWKYKTQLHE
jgi:hypothetical protein